MASLLYTPTLTALACSAPLLSQISVPLFGGAVFNLPIRPGDSPLVALARGLSGLGMQAAPLAPLIKVLLILSSVVGLVQAIATLNVGQIAAKSAQLAQAVTDIAALILWPVEMAGQVRGFLSMLIAFLQALQADINRLIARYTDVNAMIAEATAAGNTAWLANAVCAKERLDSDVAQLNALLGSIGVAIQVMSILFCLVTGGSHLAALPTLNPSALTAAVFDAPILALTIARDAIPPLTGSGAPC